MTPQYKLYPYRWAVLAVFMFINLTIQTLWISYAPITGPAAKFYGVTDLNIGFLSMVFMIAFIPLSIPVSWVIDTYGFRIAVGIGAILMASFLRRSRILMEGLVRFCKVDTRRRKKERRVKPRLR